MITIHEGDLLASNCEVICHQTNCMGAMGGGIARVIRDTYPEAYYALKQRFERGAAFVGEVDFVGVAVNPVFVVGGSLLRRELQTPLLRHFFSQARLNFFKFFGKYVS